MPMTREQVFNIINKEREYQDRFFKPDEVNASGQTRLAEHGGVTPHLVQLQQYITDAMRCWVFDRPTTNANEGNRSYTSEHGNVASLQQIAKIAAIAVRALERVNESDYLLVKGLR